MEEHVNENIVLIGTAHISSDSVNEVKSAIEKYKPQVVAVELCNRRFEALTQKDKWENTPVTSLLRGNRVYLILAQTFLASIQRRLGKEYGVEPGSEMIAAIDEAKQHGIEVALVDRDITVTLKRAWRKMGIREKWRLFWELMKAIFGFEDDETEDLDLKKIMDKDVISTMMEEFKDIAPSTASVLITERDQYIAQKIIDESKKGKVVAVLGAGHLTGVKELIENNKKPIDLTDLEYIPKKRITLGRIFAVVVPTIFIGVIVWLIMSRGQGAWDDISNIFVVWFLVHGILSAVGAAIARGHPFSILTAFIAAPFTSLEPFFAPGWFAGMVEAKLRTPVVKDFQNLRNIETMKDFFGNRVIRLMMVVALANLGSMIGTIVALPYILSLGLG